jgi:hypothetical protein
MRLTPPGGRRRHDVVRDHVVHRQARRSSASDDEDVRPANVPELRISPLANSTRFGCPTHVEALAISSPTGGLTPRQQVSLFFVTSPWVPPDRSGWMVWRSAASASPPLQCRTARCAPDGMGAWLEGGVRPTAQSARSRLRWATVPELCAPHGQPTSRQPWPISTPSRSPVTLQDRRRNSDCRQDTVASM